MSAAGFLPFRTTLLQTGFFVSLIGAPWGPIPRYLGWLIVMAALLADRMKGRRSPKLPRGLGYLMSGLMVWGFFTTLSGMQVLDPGQFLKSYSILLEALFGIWIAFRVLACSGFWEKWSMAAMATISLVGVYTVARYVMTGYPLGPFSNPGILSACAVPFIPFCFSQCFEINQGRTSRLFALCALVLSLLVLCMGLSSGNLVASFIAVLVTITFLPNRIMVLKKALFASAITAVVIVGYGCLDNHASSPIAGVFSREIDQLQSINDMTKFTSKRNYIWKTALAVVRAHPGKGIGWGKFEERFSEFDNGDWFRFNPSPPSHEHNQWLTAAVAGGFPNLALWILFEVTVLAGVIGYWMKNRDSTIAAGLMGFLSAYFVLNTVAGVLNERHVIGYIFWVFIGASIAVQYPDEKKKNDIRVFRNEPVISLPTNEPGEDL